MSDYIRVRSMKPEDIPMMAMISKDSISDPDQVITGEHIWRQFNQDQEWNSLVVVEDKVVLGFLSYRLFYEGIFLHQIAVRSHLRRDKLGTMLVNGLRAIYGTKSLSSLVPDSELTTHLFLKSQGMKCIAIRKINGIDYYDFLKKEI